MALGFVSVSVDRKIKFVSVSTDNGPDRGAGGSSGTTTTDFSSASTSSAIAGGSGSDEGLTCEISSVGSLVDTSVVDADVGCSAASVMLAEELCVAYKTS